MLSSVTINCQVTNIVINPGSQLLVFFGQVMSPHYSDQMSQRSQVSRMALWRCSQNVFAFVLVIVFVIFFGDVMSSHHSDQMCQRSQVSRMAPLGCSLMEVHR